MNWKSFEPQISQRVLTIGQPASVIDPAHDDLHLLRVVALAKHLGEKEDADLNIVVPAAWLHDFVIIPKDDPRRSQASQIAAQAALKFLGQIGYPEQYHLAIAHAIQSHSFSAKLEATTLEAKVVQDADRLDGLGAIGIARCFATGGLLKRAFYNVTDPFCEQRIPSDQEFTVDHFYQKLFVVAGTLKTAAARKIAEKRVCAMQSFLDSLKEEIQPLHRPQEA